MPGLTELKDLIGDYPASLRAAILDPAGHFARTDPEGSLLTSIIQTCLHGLLAGVFGLIWNLTGLSGAVIEGLDAGIGSHLLGVATSVFLAVACLFLGGIIFWLTAMSCGGEGNFESALSVMTIILALYPLKAMLGFAASLGFYADLTAALGVSVLSLRLVYLGLTVRMQAERRKALVACAVLALIPAFMLLSGLSYYNLSRNYQS